MNSCTSKTPGQFSPQEDTLQLLITSGRINGFRMKYFIGIAITLRVLVLVPYFLKMITM